MKNNRNPGELFKSAHPLKKENTIKGKGKKKNKARTFSVSPAVVVTWKLKSSFPLCGAIASLCMHQAIILEWHPVTTVMHADLRRVSESRLCRNEITAGRFQNIEQPNVSRLQFVYRSDKGADDTTHALLNMFFFSCALEGCRDFWATNLHWFLLRL